ncbi:hypothetical protein T02_13999 [Trichinella nativa]|uniref:Uncharacterized protein n=1 Tax=Trichinella nativa TaxID=6335 RepID=A0A0V1KT90_9BILA|nr:hypothetical protein T02_13999 [Trichinella nativa]
MKGRQIWNWIRKVVRCSLVGANCSPARAAPRVIEPKKTSRPELSLPQLHGSMPGRCLHNLTTIDATIFDEHLKCSNYPRPLSIYYYYSLCMPRTVQAALLGSLSPLLTANAKSVIGVQCSRKGRLFVFAL